jgi:hypothetical protein
MATRDSLNISELLIDRTIELAFTKLRVGWDATPEQVEEVVRLVDEGGLDDAIEARAPSREVAARRRRFETLQEFSYEAWKNRRGLKD